MKNSGKAIWVYSLTILLAATLAYSQNEPAGEAAKLLTCESQPGSREYCSADTSNGVALATQMSSESCLLGKTWGYDDKGVWVADGCGAQFVVGNVDGASGEQGDGFLRKFEPYGRFQGHVAFFDDEAEIQDNVSLLGLKFETGDRFKLFAQFELGTNLIGNVDQFRAGARTDSGLLTLEEIENPDVFGPRLGFLGVDFGEAGRVALGKDWGMHYSIAGYTTDRWNAFGGQASMAYPGYGDGGVSGTGRADQVVNYRVTVAEIVELGAQVQFSSSQKDVYGDGYGASVQVTVLPGLKLGGAYTQLEMTDQAVEELIGVTGNAKYSILGAKYSSEFLDVGVVWSTQKNGDARYIFEPGVQDPEQIPVFFDGSGVEIYLKGKFGRWGLIGGYIDYDPDTEGTFLDPDFRTRYLIIGADWQITEGTGFYTEFRIDDSVGAEGQESSSVGVFGLKYVFRWKTSHSP